VSTRSAGFGRSSGVRARSYASPMRQALLLVFMAMLGLVALLYGVWQVYPPAAWILGGMLVLGEAIHLTRVPEARSDS